MFERWMPVLVIAVGVLGGMGGALVGGYIANEGQKQRFEDEQAAQRQALMRDVFADYLRAVQGIITGADSQTLLTPEARVEIVARGDEVGKAAMELAESVGVDILSGQLVENPRTPFKEARIRFIEAARAELAE
jgi:hypothetical protein